MHQHIAASKGHEDRVMVLLKHACNEHIRDINGNTALWDAVSAKHSSIFWILYHCASLSDPYTAGDLLCTAAKRNDLTVMKELLKHGLNIDSKNHQGLTATQISMDENHTDMVKLLVMNGADVIHANTYEFSSETLNEMLQKREMGHQIVMPDTLPTDHETLLRGDGEEKEFKTNGGFTGTQVPRVSIYGGHPLERKDSCCTEAGRLMRLPTSLMELKAIAGEKLGFDATNAMVTNEEGAEINSIEVIRDNNRLFLVEDPNSLM